MRRRRVVLPTKKPQRAHCENKAAVGFLAAAEQRFARAQHARLCRKGDFTQRALLENGEERDTGQIVDVVVLGHVESAKARYYRLL